jgi:uncharacterized protein CbrC (UPF0167 family)
MATFADLGILFPLFEAPVSEASDYAGESTCVVCGGRNQHCFVLNVGCALIIPCPACTVENGLDAHRRKARPCRSCGSEISFPAIPQKTEIRICYSCLRSGKGAITKDTEFGMVSWEQAFQGVTNGVPGLRTTQFETVVIDPEEEWYGVRVSSEHLFELLRTPNFCTWQDESWLFCCQRPMTYIGEWQNVLRSPHRPNDPRSFFESLIDSDDDIPDLWEPISQARESPCLYVYQCKICGRHRATWDMD